MARYSDRYSRFRSNGEVKAIPFIPIPTAVTDKRDVYELGKTRFDVLSQKYYGNPYHGYLILSANPQFGGLEFLIPNGEVIRVPFPFNSALERYDIGVTKHIKLYGN